VIRIFCFVLFTVLGSKISRAQECYMPGVLGVWLSENKKQKVRVTYDATKKIYTGKIIWMYEDDQAEGRVLLDKNNPNPKLRTRRITGINLMLNFQHEGDGVFRGYVYDPISGKQYRCLMTLQPDKKTAHIRGYIMIPWIGRTEIATKISD
jgi:uncharacterized protein (DUF2147 family)